MPTTTQVTSYTQARQLPKTPHPDCQAQAIIQVPPSHCTSNVSRPCRPRASLSWVVRLSRIKVAEISNSLHMLMTFSTSAVTSLWDQVVQDRCFNDLCKAARGQLAKLFLYLKALTVFEGLTLAHQPLISLVHCFLPLKNVSSCSPTSYGRKYHKYTSELSRRSRHS
jgi:hypothetical protein